MYGYDKTQVMSYPYNIYIYFFASFCAEGGSPPKSGIEKLGLGGFGCRNRFLRATAYNGTPSEKKRLEAQKAMHRLLMKNKVRTVKCR